MNALTVTRKLIIINAVVFALGLVSSTLSDRLHAWFAYSWASAVEHAQLWRFISYQFLHANLGHLIFNMMALHFFGEPVEALFGGRRFLIFYLLCGMAGALFSSLLAGMGLYATTFSAGNQLWAYPWEQVPLIGASAAVYGIMVAVAFLYPDVRISLLFPPITLKLRTFALGVIGIAAFTILFNLSNAGGEAGHLGGIIMGALLMLLRRATRHRHYLP